MGCLSVVSFKQNGEMRDSALRRPFNMSTVVSMITGNGWPTEEIKEAGIGGWDYVNGPLDMDLRILDILMIVERDPWGFRMLPALDDECPQRWLFEIELYAPGHLMMEAEGRGGEYDYLNRLRSPSEGDRLREAQGRPRGR